MARIPVVVRLQRSVAKLPRRLARIGALLVWPFEWFAVSILGAVFRASERIENVEVVFAAFVRFATWPFRATWNLLARLMRRVVPRSARNIIATPFYAAARVASGIALGAMRAAEALNIDGLLFRIAHFSKPLWYPFAALGTFVVIWAATRPYKKLLWALPPLIFIAPVLVATAWGAYLGKSTIAERYRFDLSRSLEQKDYARAELLERKLASLGINTSLSEFNTAQALAHHGKVAEAYERMQQLAPLNSTGYPLAHIWIIENLLTNKLNVPPDKAHELAGIHLDHLAALGIKGPEVDMMRAAWFTQSGKLPEAAALLKPLVHGNASAAVERFRINLAIKNHEQAILDAREVHDHLQRRVQEGNAPSDHEYESWAAAEQLLGETTAYRQIAREWFKRFPESSAARKNVVAISLQEFDEILSSANSNPQELADRLRTAFTLTNATQNMKERVALLYRQRSDQPILRTMFEELSKKPDLPSSLAETLGTAAAITGEWDTAEFYLKQAIARDPGNAIAWNNLSCALLQKPKPPLESALAAAEKACALSPNDFRFRETRGEIRVKLGRWQEAIDDLEYALNGLPDNAAIHQSLGKAYEAVGNKELAAVHLQYAD